jgi:hypothetical protein
VRRLFSHALTSLSPLTLCALRVCGPNCALGLLSSSISEQIEQLEHQNTASHSTLKSSDEDVKQAVDSRLSALERKVAALELAGSEATTAASDAKIAASEARTVATDAKTAAAAAQAAATTKVAADIKAAIDEVRQDVSLKVGEVSRLTSTVSTTVQELDNGMKVSATEFATLRALVQSLQVLVADRCVCVHVRMQMCVWTWVVSVACCPCVRT